MFELVWSPDDGNASKTFPTNKNIATTMPNIREKLASGKEKLSTKLATGKEKMRAGGEKLKLKVLDLVFMLM